jgi:DNA-binding transcriptional LysR family regulator
MSIKKVPLDEMVWDDLRVFLAIVRTGSLSQAAKHMKLDHSTVSRRLAQLELCLGGALFERHRTGLKRTELAQSILANVETMEGEVISLREAVGGGDSHEPAGTVRVAMMEGIGSLYLARRLLPLLDQYPDIRIELVTSAQLVNVSRREADIFLSFFKPTGRGLFCEVAGRFALSLFGSQAYFDRYGEPKSLDELEQHQFVGYVDDLIQVDTVRWLDEVITKPKIAFFSNSMIAQMAAAASGLGLVMLPRFAIEKELQLRPVLLHEVNVNRELYLSVHNDLQFSSRVKVVLRFIKELLESDQPYLNAT